MSHPNDPCGPCSSAEGAPTYDPEQQTSGGVCTFCDRDRRNNVWVEGVVDENGTGGVCMLDTMTEAQIIDVIQHDERARQDLKKVTSNEHLLSLAETVPPLPSQNDGDKLQIEMNQQADSIPFYSIFRGQPPFAQ